VPVYTNEDIAGFNDILRGTGEGSGVMKLALFQNYPVSPPNSATGNRLDIARGRITPTRYPTDVVAFTKLKVDDDGERVAYITLAASPDPIKQGALTFDCTTADATATAARATKAPIWWLPWRSHHMVKVKLAPAGTAVWDAQNVPLPNPDLFFTAAVSGCSVFVRGNPTAPSVYHGGIDGKLVDAKQGKFLARGVFNKSQFKRVGGSTPAFWRQVLSGMDYDATAGDIAAMKPTPGGDKFNQPNKPVSEVNTTHYTSDKGTKTTVNSRALEKFLQKQAVARGRTIDAVIPWGSVFGLRVGGNWTFYLQQNVTVMYTKTASNQKITDSVVLACSAFFPGEGEANPPVLKTRDFERIEHALA
jgi:hypothetical protein